METFVELLTFCLVCFGATNILVYGKIFDKVRPKHYFFGCSVCIGFWVGVILSLIPNGLFAFELDGTTQTFCGFLSSGVSYVLCSLFNDDGLKFVRKVIYPKEDK